MNQVINNVLIGLNNLGRMFCDYAASVFVQSALLVILLFVVDLLLRKRVRAIFRYCLWMLVLVKLVLPPMLSLPTGIGYWVGDHLPASSVLDRTSRMAWLERESLSGEMSQVRPSQDIAEDDALTAPNISALTPLTWQAVLFILWLVGVLAFLVVLVQRVRFVRGLIAMSNPAKEELLGLLEQCRRQIGIRVNIMLRVSEAIASPAVCGFFRPTVLIPAPLVEKLSPEGLRATLIHELAHIKRGDLWVNSVQTFLQVVYFYNPFVWFANAVIRRVCEEAVDEMVLVTLGGQAKDYSNTLIDIGEMAFWRANLGLRLVGVAESKKVLKWRIKHMLTRPIPKSSKLGALGIIVIFSIAAVLLPMARAQKPGGDDEPIAAGNEGESAQLLYQAASRGDVEKVKLLISKGADVKATGTIGWTPLLAAVGERHPQVVKVLLENGAEVDVGDGWYTPLYYAIWNDDKEMVKTLISSGADVNTRPKEGDYPPLVYAVWYSHPDIIKILIDAGAEVNAEDEDGWAPLRHALQRTYADVAKQFIGTGIKISAFHNAILEGNLPRVKEFIKGGMDVDKPDKFGWTPTYWALSAGHKEVAEYLLSQGADITAKTQRGRTLLHQASTAGLVEIVESLIAEGVEVDAKCDAGATPLQYAAAAGQEAAIKLLIANGANVNVTAKNGTHPLGDAAVAGHEEVVKLLLASGANVNLQPEDRLMCGTALHAAASGGHSTILDILIAHGADVNALYKHGTPLHLAIVGRAGADDKRRAEIVEKLLAQGANVNTKSPSRGRTPLHEAANKGRFKLAECLIAAGSDINAKDNGGHTPLWHANNRGHSDVAELLSKHGAAGSLHDAVAGGDISQVKRLISKGADVNAKTNKGVTPLHLACLHGHRDMAELLVAKGANLNAKTDEGVTPLHAGALVGNKEICELLISKGAKVNVKSGEVDVEGTKDEGWTPLHAACVRGHKEVAELLLAHGADKNAKTREGETPSSQAKRKRHTEIVELLRKHGAKE